jgi:hypothetical protein
MKLLSFHQLFFFSSMRKKKKKRKKEYIIYLFIYLFPSKMLHPAFDFFGVNFCTMVTKKTWKKNSQT